MDALLQALRTCFDDVPVVALGLAALAILASHPTTRLALLTHQADPCLPICESASAHAAEEIIQVCSVESFLPLDLCERT
jgi:hypothetical protein